MSLNLDIQEKVIIPIEELEPEVVRGGVEVKDDITDTNNTWSSQKLSNEFHSLNDGLTQAIEDIDLSPYELLANKSTDGTLTDNSDAKYPSQKAIKTYVDTGLGTKQNSLGYTAENIANKENGTLDTSITKYPTNRLVKEYLDLKQSTSGKDAANGYLSLDANAQYLLSKINTREIVYYNSLKHIKDRGTTTGSSETFNSAASTGASFLLSNVLVMNAGDTIRLPRPILQISTTNANCATYAQANTSLERIGSPLIQTREALIMGKTSGLTTDSSFYYGLHTGGANQDTVGNNGTGLLFKRNPTVNSGNWQIIKLVGGIPSLILNTSVTYSDFGIYKLKVIYNKSTEIATFYINDVLIHIQNSVNLDSTLNYYSYWCYSQGVSIDGTTKQFGIISFLEVLSGL